MEGKGATRMHGGERRIRDVVTSTTLRHVELEEMEGGNIVVLPSYIIYYIATYVQELTP
jgi:hypothetical protein